MRIACCQLIQSLSSGSLDVYLDSEEGRKDAEEALVFLERILGCGKEHMYGPASAAYGSLCNEVIAKDVDWHVKVTKRIVKGISSGKVFEHQRGFALAAGVCGVSGEVAAVLCNEVSSNRDVEVRRNSATSLGIMPESVLRQRTVQILRALVGGMQDYATDDRGDIGSWVREESMKSSVKIVQAIFVGTSKLYMVQNSDEEAAMLRILSAIVEQCCSKIDRTRGIAGSALRSVCEAFVCDSGNERLMKLCDNVLDCMKYRCSAGEGDTMNFSDSVSAFGAMQNLMTVPELSDAVMSGFISSIGGTGHQAKAAVHALVSYVQNLKPDAKERCLSKVVGVIEVRHERLALPALNVLDILLQHEVLEDLDRNKLRQAAVIVKTSWRKRLRDVKRTSAAVSVLGALASHSVQNSSFDFREGTLGRECLEALVIVLGGPIPRLRRITAESLYMVLLEFDLDRSDGDAIWNALCGKVRDTLNVLADTEWEQKDILGARERRNSICNLLNIRIPTALRAEKPS